MYRITIRATQEAVPQALAKQFEQRLSLGVSLPATTREESVY